MVGTVLSSAGAGVIFGLALAAPPGPMNAIIAEESVLRGWTAGFKAGLGAMVADLLFFVLALAGAVTIVESFPRLRAAMITAGGVLMLYFAYGAAESVSDTLTGEGSPGPSRGFSKAFVLGITNPYQILFWLTVGIGLLRPGTVDILGTLPAFGDRLAGVLVVETGSPVLLGGLFAGIGAWIVVFPLTLVAGKERVDAFAPIVAAASAVILAGIGVVFVLDGLSTLL